ncbi:nascent polypeptide-associated complex subunit alpha isoform X20 [Manacus candei]|uniref:nascent polypeptide-associated complex subunit alpha isoform X20 n=1 Tax=Manacus candei TaxID=415023 RepID=UPI002226DB8F|nr:nascent polypeptide-associated complex subunit alpha isoform X20 [Manacus candei]
MLPGAPPCPGSAVLPEAALPSRSLSAAILGPAPRTKCPAKPQKPSRPRSRSCRSRRRRQLQLPPFLLPSLLQLFFMLLIPHLWLHLHLPRLSQCSPPALLPRLCRAPQPPPPPPWSRPWPSLCSLCLPSPLPQPCRAQSPLPLLWLRRPPWVLQPRDLQGLPRLAQDLQDSRLRCPLLWLLLLLLSALL